MKKTAPGRLVASNYLLTTKVLSGGRREKREEGEGRREKDYLVVERQATTSHHSSFIIHPSSFIRHFCSFRISSSSRVYPPTVSTLLSAAATAKSRSDVLETNLGPHRANVSGLRRSLSYSPRGTLVPKQLRTIRLLVRHGIRRCHLSSLPSTANFEPVRAGLSILHSPTITSPQRQADSFESRQFR